jgi:small subunit ribosomal protein S2
VGTKPQAAHSIALAAKSCNSYYINQRWLGGLLTNWSTLRRSIGLLNRMELIQRQRVVETLPKKLKSSFSREHARLRKYLGGIDTMRSIPDVVIIVGQHEESIALNECEKLGIRTITLLDTNCNPDSADLFVPVNDDSIKAIRSILNNLSTEINKV